MKKKLALIITLFVLLLFIFIIFKNININKIYLEKEYYQKKEIIELNDVEELNTLIKSGTSFAILYYQPSCIVSSNFEEVINSFLDENELTIYKISFQKIIDTNINKYIKYYPSFAIYSNKKVIDYLESNKDEDIDYYLTSDGFKTWFTKYVYLKAD